MKKFLLLSAIMAFLTVSCTRITDISQIVDCCEKKDYQPQIIEDFRLDVAGYSKILDLNLSYMERYSLSITNGEIGFPEKYKFNGKLKLQFFYKNKLVRERQVVEQEVAVYGTKRKGFYFNEITLTYFDLPLDRKYKDNLSLKVTVVEPDTTISEFGKELKIVIGVNKHE